MTHTDTDAQNGAAQKAAEAAEGELQDQETGLVEYNAWVLQQYPGGFEAFLAMLGAVPEPDDDAAARIVMEILDAQSIEDLDKPWDVEGMRDFDGTMLQVEGITKMPSDYKTGLGCYLVCRCTQPGIGEVFTLTTGSVSIVAQLVRAHTLNAFPLQVIPRQSERPTRKGYRPMHLEMVRRGRRVRANVIDQAPATPSKRELASEARRQRIMDEARAANQAAAATEAGQ